MKRLFEGPGNFLIVPTGPRITNPKCNHKERLFGPNKYRRIKNNPPCICTYPQLKVPFGYYWDDEKLVVLEPKVYERNGYKYTFGNK